MDGVGATGACAGTLHHPATAAEDRPTKQMWVRHKNWRQHLVLPPKRDWHSHIRQMFKLPAKAQIVLVAEDGTEVSVNSKGFSPGSGDYKLVLAPAAAAAAAASAVGPDAVGGAGTAAGALPADGGCDCRCLVMQRSLGRPFCGQRAMAADACPSGSAGGAWGRRPTRALCRRAGAEGPRRRGRCSPAGRRYVGRSVGVQCIAVRAAAGFVGWLRPRAGCE